MATVLESALEEEMSEHLGYDSTARRPRAAQGIVRNGIRAKTVLSEAALPTWFIHKCR
jgi:transposase-like protein